MNPTALSLAVLSALCFSSIGCGSLRGEAPREVPPACDRIAVVHAEFSDAELSNHAGAVDVLRGELAHFLEERGIEVLPADEYRRLWNASVREAGSPLYDPDTGRFDMALAGTLRASLRHELSDERAVDGFLEIGVDVVPVKFLGVNAIWDGRSQYIFEVGPGDPPPGPVQVEMQAYSLVVRLLGPDGQLLFPTTDGQGRGGISVISMLNRFGRWQDLGEDEVFSPENLRKALEIAFPAGE